MIQQSCEEKEFVTASAVFVCKCAHPLTPRISALLFVQVLKFSVKTVRKAIEYPRVCRDEAMGGPGPFTPAYPVFLVRKLFRIDICLLTT